MLCTLCGTTPLLGGSGVLTSPGWFRRKYTSLPSHQSVLMKIVFWFIDDWTVEDMLKVRVSNGSVTTFHSQVLVTSYNQSTGTGMVCGETEVYDLMPVYLFMKGPHVGDNLILEVMNANFNTLEMVYYGIREISLTFSTTKQSSTVYYGLSNPVSLLQDTHYTCAIGKYLSGSTCKDCDDSCGACWGSGAKKCYFCNSDYYYDATQCVACDSSCETCTGSLATQCMTCPSGSYLYNNNSCISKCKSPYTTRAENGIDYCDFPCDIGEYYYPINSTCQSSVSFPFTARADGLNLFADYPCNSSSYVYPDRTCKLYCNSPMIIETPYQTKLCKKPCSNKTPYYLTAKQQCNATCDAPYLTSSSAYYKTCYRVLNNPLTWMMNTIAPYIAFSVLGASIILMGFPWAIIVMISGRMLQYARYLSVSFATGEDQMEATWNLRYIRIDFLVDIPSAISNQFSYKAIPDIFTLYSDSSSFLVNFWPVLLPLAVTLGCLVVFFPLEWLCRKMSQEGGIGKLFKWPRVIAQNFLITLVYGSIGNIALYAIFEINFSQFTTKVTTMSFVLCLLMIALGGSLLLVHLMFLLKQQKQRKGRKTRRQAQEVEKFSKNYPGLQVLSKELKFESMSQQGFLLFMAFRDVFFTISLLVLVSYPLIQSAFIASLNLLTIIYVIVSKPFRSVWDQLQQYFYDVMICITYLLAALVSYLDNDENEYISLRDTLGRVILYFNMAFNFGVIGFLVLKVLRLLHAWYRKMNPPKIPLRLINQHNHRLSSQHEKLMISNLDGVNMTDTGFSHQNSSVVGESSVPLKNPAGGEDIFSVSRISNLSHILEEDNSRILNTDSGSRNTLDIEVHNRQRGVIKPKKGDQLYYQKSTFSEQGVKNKARAEKLKKLKKDNKPYGWTNLPLTNMASTIDNIPSVVLSHQNSNATTTTNVDLKCKETDLMLQNIPNFGFLKNLESRSHSKPEEPISLTGIMPRRIVRLKTEKPKSNNSMLVNALKGLEDGGSGDGSLYDFENNLSKELD